MPELSREDLPEPRRPDREFSGSGRVPLERKANLSHIPDASRIDLNICGSLPPIPPEYLPVAQVRGRLSREGFPELVLAWRQFEALGRNASEISATDLADMRRRHMRRVGIFECAGAGIGLLSGVLFAHVALPVGGALGNALAMFTALNLGGLGYYTGMIARRYVFAPLSRVLGLHVGPMLSTTNFRAEVGSSDQFRTFRRQREQRGIRSSWDDPSYRRWYSTSGLPLPPQEHDQPAQLTLHALREVIGSKDPQLRKHMPGRFASFVVGGKSAIARFVSEHAEQIAAAKDGTLSTSEGVQLLSSLEAMIVPQSSAMEFLQTERLLLSGERPVRSGMVQAEVWARDPWVDLTHQEEFFSSAALRGVKMMGRGPKGRLGCIDYLRVPEVCCLDLRTSAGRMVRCRMLVADAVSLEGDTEPVLFVDGVEGSNAIRPEVIDAAITEYATNCGILNIVYNLTVHNQTPARFVRFVRERKEVSIGMVTLRPLGSEERLYLDSVGYPLEPFEYAALKGKVHAAVKRLSRDAADSEELDRDRLCTPQTMIDSLREFVRHNLLWILVGETVLYSASMTALSEPRALLGLFLIAGSGVYFQLKHHRRADTAGKRAARP